MKRRHRSSGPGMEGRASEKGRRPPLQAGEFEFFSAGRVIFGAGSIGQTADAAVRLGRCALVVTGRSALAGDPDPHGGWTARDTGSGARSAGRVVDAPRRSLGRDVPLVGRDAAFPGSESRFGTLAASLSERGVSVVHYLVRGEPTTRVADDGARRALAARCDCVIALGGGSVLDAAKAISALMTNGGEALDYLEVVGRGRPIESAAAPLIAIPTTGGTGSEVTKNAVLTVVDSRVKVSMRSPLLLPAVAIVDPDLARSLPPQETASTALDALTQLIEAYLTPKANAVTDLFALEGIHLSGRSLLRAFRDGTDASARGDLALASLFGGIGLANAGLGAVHGIAAPLGGRHPVPHGLACAVLLPHVFALNLRALRISDPAAPALARIARVGETLRRSASDPVGSPLESDYDDPADVAVDLIGRIVETCRLPGLAAYGVHPGDIPAIVEGALRASSMKGNPVALAPEQLASAIAAAL